MVQSAPELMPLPIAPQPVERLGQGHFMIGNMHYNIIFRSGNHMYRYSKFGALLYTVKMQC